MAETLQTEKLQKDLEQLGLEDEADGWERLEGIPQAHDEVIQKYFQGRDGLIAQEDKRRSDRNFRESLSPMAMEACSIVSQIRFEEQQTIWTNDVANRNAAETGDIYPGMMFMLAKERAQSTKLYEIIKRMPKGALLHCHLEATVDLTWLFQEALRVPGIHISAARGMPSAEDRASVVFIFRYVQKSTSPNVSIWSAEYVPDTWVPLVEAAKSFPESGEEGFINWAKGRLSITPEESIKHHLGTNEVWRKFLSCFGVLKTLIYYEPLYRKFLRKFFEELMKDGVRWADVRAAFFFEYRKEGCEEPEEGYDEVVRVFGEEVELFKKTEIGKTFWGSRLIWTTIRAFDKREIVDSMQRCIEAKLEFPEVIAGFDLVGQEDLGAPLAELLPILLHFRTMCVDAKVNIPFFFHAGETCGTGTDTDLNLFDAVLLGTRRLGHATSLYKHPLLIDLARDRQICVECCPVSNEVLRFCASISAHPLPAMLANGVPVALCNDDPAILGQDESGLTFDFWQTLQGIQSVGLEGLGAMAENSVRYAIFEDESPKEWTEGVKAGAYGQGIRAQRMKEWKRDWERFVQWIVMEHGVDMDLEEQD